MEQIKDALREVILEEQKEMRRLKAIEDEKDAMQTFYFFLTLAGGVAFYITFCALFN